MRYFLSGIIVGLIICVLILSFAKIKTPFITIMNDGDNIRSHYTELSDDEWINFKFIIDYGIYAGVIEDTIYFFETEEPYKPIYKIIIGEENEKVRTILVGNRIFINKNDLLNEEILTK